MTRLPPSDSCPDSTTDYRLSPTDHPYHVDKKLHHPVLVDLAMPPIRADLDVEALTSALQRIDQLQRVRRVDVVVRGTVVEEQAPIETRRVGQRAARVVSALVVFGQPHIDRQSVG